MASKMVLSETEKITLLIIRGYEDLVRSFEQITILFNTNQIVNRFRSLQYRKRSNDLKKQNSSRIDNALTKSAINVNKNLEMMETFVENPHSILGRKAA